MSDTCLFPTCSRHPEKNGYCIGHRIYASSTAVSVPKEIPKRSDKMKDMMKEAKKKYILFLSRPENKYCKVRIDDGCKRVATVIHHTRGREGDQLLNEEDWLPACIHCNRVLEEKDALAREKGVKKSKHAKVLSK